MSLQDEVLITHTIIMKVALRAGPRADSMLMFFSNKEGRLSSSASTTTLDSDKFTSKSSGRGKNGSSRSATTIICGCISEDCRHTQPKAFEVLSLNSYKLTYHHTSETHHHKQFMTIVMKTFAIVSLRKCCQHKPSSDLYLTTGTSDLANFAISQSLNRNSEFRVNSILWHEITP